MKDVLLVCGFGRCGSSLMMQMLQAGGIPVAGEYPAFEHDGARVGAIDMGWLEQQAGRAVKVLDPHKSPSIDFLPHLAIWIDRNEEEQAKSHAKFLAALTGIVMDRGQRRAFAASFRQERRHAMRCASGNPDRLYRTTFEMLVETPAAVLTVLTPWLANFGFALDAERAKSVVRPRGRKCLPHLLELELLA